MAEAGLELAFLLPWPPVAGVAAGSPRGRAGLRFNSGWATWSAQAAGVGGPVGQLPVPEPPGPSPWPSQPPFLAVRLGGGTLGVRPRAPQDLPLRVSS